MKKAAYYSFKMLVLTYKAKRWMVSQSRRPKYVCVRRTSHWTKIKAQDPFRYETEMLTFV
jgi:hypothetical protein